jgi:hypothetical protein
MTTKIVCIYEAAQAATVAEYVRMHPEVLVIALDFWAGRALKKIGVESIPLSEYCVPYEDLSALLTQSEDVAREWYQLPVMHFFQHRNIPLGEAVEPAIDSYLQQLLYQIHTLQTVLSKHKDLTCIVVPHSTYPVPPTAGPFAAFEGSIVVDTIRFLGAQKQYGYKTECIGNALPVANVAVFPLQPRGLVLLLRLYNAIISLLVPAQSLKLFASEYWTHISAVFDCVDDVELVMMDRSEMRKIPWRQLLKHRMRFMHPLTEVDQDIVDISKERQSYFTTTWKSAKPIVAQMPYFHSGNLDWWPLAAGAFDFIVTRYAERIVSDAEGIRKILEREGIDKVLLRASMSLHQHHFYSAAKIAEGLSIPSIEIQHAGAMMDPHSSFSRLETSYLAAYGTLTRNFLVRAHGVAPERVVPVGSPRFDRYLSIARITNEERDIKVRSLGLDPHKPIVLVGVPGEFASLSLTHHSSFEVAKTFADVRTLQAAIPDLQVLFKFRPRGASSLHRAYLQELFNDGRIAIAEYEDLFSMLQLADIVLSPNSSVIYEAMIAQKPVILFPWKMKDPHLSIYMEGGIAVGPQETIVGVVKTLVGSQPSYAEAVQKGGEFLRKNYSFDGRAAERTALLVQNGATAMHTL